MQRGIVSDPVANSTNGGVHLMDNFPDAEQSEITGFWGEIAPCEHLVQIYD